MGAAAPTYNENFYSRQKDSSYRSAKLVLDYVFSLYRPRSVVDFGCGVGTWLKAACELNNSVGLEGRYVGLDGDWGGKEKVLPDFIDFRAVDLAKPPKLEDRFELAISLEVAEHLPTTSAQAFVASLTQASNVVLFGAAIPGQGGENHVNEQYQSWWYALFEERGFVCLDLLRPSFFNDDRVGVAYRQNSFVYVKWGSDEWQYFEKLPLANPKMLDIVHPIVFERHSKRVWGVKSLVRQLAIATFIRPFRRR